VKIGTRAEAGRAVGSAFQFLRRAQDRDGAWRDFQLAPGPSESWTTAYVGSSLFQAKAHWPALDIEPCVAVATRFLSATRLPGGWSYNQKVEEDADSTARVILFLNRTGTPSTPKDYAALAKFQLADGHFAAYKDVSRRQGWARGHPDVTAVALRAMGGFLEPGHAILRHAESALRRHGATAHAGRSYWWASPFYLAHELLLLERAYPGAPKLELPPQELPALGGSFDLGLALGMGILRGFQPEKLGADIGELLGLQLPDGSWPATPILRLTHPQAGDFDDVRFRNSPLFPDDRRTFTTATVLAALSGVP